MEQYQTTLYRALIKADDPSGWDYGEILFQSAILDNPTQAMAAFNDYPVPETDWIGTMKTIVNGEVTEEQIFDSSLMQIL